MNWNLAEDRAELIERVGADEYNRLFAKHRKQIVIKTVNGHEIRPTTTRFGRLFTVGNTGKAFIFMEEAESFANKTPNA